MKFPVLHTERLDLIEMNHTHLDDYFRIFSCPEVVKYYNLNIFTSREDGKVFIDTFHEGFEKGLFMRWGIALKGESRIIGTLGFNNYSENHRATVGYDLDYAHWNKGYVTEALREILPYGFDVLHVNRIEAEVLPDNKGSVRVLEKLGFKKEGHLRDWFYWNGEHFDCFIFSLLKRDYDLTRKQDNN